MNSASLIFARIPLVNNYYRVVMGTNTILPISKKKASTEDVVDVYFVRVEDTVVIKSYY